MTASPESIRKDAMRALLEKARLGGEETATRIAQARDPDYWRQLNPQLSVEHSDSPQILQRSDLDPISADAAVESFARYGWFDAGVVVDASATTDMKAGLERVREHGWPEAFVFVYDEFWLASRLPHLVRIIEGILGSGYRQLPHIWGHYVAPGSTGWRPHVDGAAPNRLTLWIGLNEADVDNACMYLVPADRAPAKIVETFTSFTTVAREDVLDLLRFSRALPTSAGSALSWHQQVIHWGSPSYLQSGARISFSQEFIAADAAPESHELPLIPVEGALPSLPERLHFVATAVLAYARFEPLMTRFTALAKTLVRN